MPHHELKQKPQDTARHQPYFKGLYNMYVPLWMVQWYFDRQFQHGDTTYGA